MIFCLQVMAQDLQYGQWLHFGTLIVCTFSIPHFNLKGCWKGLYNNKDHDPEPSYKRQGNGNRKRKKKVLIVLNISAVLSQQKQMVLLPRAHNSAVLTHREFSVMIFVRRKNPEPRLVFLNLSFKSHGFQLLRIPQPVGRSSHSSLPLIGPCSCLILSSKWRKI